MKATLLKLVLGVALLAPIAFFVSGCGEHQHSASGEPVYHRMPKAEHERMFPEGHGRGEHRPGYLCSFNEKENVYYCAH